MASWALVLWVQVAFWVLVLWARVAFWTLAFVSTHIGIAAVLWDQTIKSVCAVMFVLICSMVWSQSNAAIRM